jgi:hypothetical protein
LSLSLQEHGFHDIQAIVDAPQVDIDALTYKDCQGNNVVHLPKNHKYMILLLKSYHWLTCSAWGNHIGNDWKSLTAQDFDDFVEQRGFEPASLRQVPSIQSTTPIKPKEATIAHETPSKALIALKPASKESIALQSPPKASIALKTPSKAPIVLETSSKASIILDMPSKICQEAHCSRTQVVTPELMPEPSTPFSSFLLCHASKAAAQITSLLQPSPSPQMDVMTFDEEEEHTIVFDEMASPPSTLAPSAPNVTPIMMEIFSSG